MKRLLWLLLFVTIGCGSLKKELPYRDEAYRFFGMAYPENVGCDYSGQPFYIILQDSLVVVGTPENHQIMMLDVYYRTKKQGLVFSAYNQQYRAYFDIDCRPDKPTGQLKCGTVFEFVDQQSNTLTMSLICGLRN